MQAETFETKATDPNNVRMAVQSTVRAAAEWLVDRQKPDGHWVGPAESNACLDAQWCLALWFLGLEDHPLRVRLGQSLLDKPSGPTAPGKSITAPRTATSTPPSRPMPRCARSAIATTSRRSQGTRLDRVAKGGLRNIRVFTRYWLALIGEWPWEKTPNIAAGSDLVSALVPVLDL